MEMPKPFPEALGRLVDALPWRERFVIEHRFGLGCDPKTREQIGVLMNLTRERIRQIEMKAIKKLKHPSRRKQFQGLLELCEKRREFQG